MIDGPTGFHVAPITEDDMFKVKDILQRAADAIVGMSQLSADVTALRDTVNMLQADTDKLRGQNNALDEALNYSRGERDRQSALLSEVNAQLHSAVTEKEQVLLQNDKLELANEQYQIDLDLTRKAKDDAEFHNLELEDKLKAAEAKLAKVAELHRSLFPVEAPPWTKPAEPTPEPVPTPPYLPVEQTEAEWPDSRETWDTGYYWDHTTGKYWRVGITPKPDGEAIPF